jgi:hypothetical protein
VFKPFPKEIQMPTDTTTRSTSTTRRIGLPNDGKMTSTPAGGRPRRRTLRQLLVGAVLPLALVFGAAGNAEAASITRMSSFECAYHSATVYFPDLKTTTGNESVNFSPDLYKYSSSGWTPYDTTKPWFRATVGPNGIYTINGYKWFLNQTPFRNISFSNLSPGYYAVKGYFYAGSSHWANVYGSSSTYCFVS